MFAAELAVEIYLNSHFSYLILADVEKAKKNTVKEIEYLKKLLNFLSMM
ncbi:hypothetical protein RT723_10635 [Psychrosphaera aquimarina]|uniref:Uncharacterized protein n=1 Tax=Psychrosphaera aquimarina TaxID=2044854 RepID=A0ABU3R189_9GAMM|nr:hypothetical protein [Psychrosphaera aquimarina]MDU0113445.1 hypothetical protein [Psychrosphaera aquimarina]